MFREFAVEICDIVEFALEILSYFLINNPL